ncbi:MAG TPA: hypothetical protein VFR03_13770 [Thermoanaerobaculia bacterium]|nr:hypothetical protein [Thermoanaerobaculia bacterium]
MNDERLRQILRRGDPAGGDGGLTPDEARAMRRAVVTAVPERKRRLLPVLALAGTMATAVLIAMVLLRPEPASPPERPRIAATPVRPAPPAAQIPVQPAPRPLQQEEESRPVHNHPQHRHRRPAAPETPAINDTLASLAAAEPERQIQLTAPGGTRILWILKSGKASR